MARKDKTTVSKNKQPDPQPEVVINQPATEPAALQPVGETALAEWDFGDAAGAGRETIRTAMIKIPLLRFVQKGTPGVDDPGKTDPLFAAGNLQNPVTKKCYDGKVGLKWQFITLIHEFLEWKPEQGGLVDRHEPDSEMVKWGRKEAKEKGRPFGEFVTPNGNDLVEYMGGMGIAEDPATGERFFAQVSVKSTGIPPFQSYVSTISTNTQLPNGQSVDANKIPLFSYVGRITTSYQTKDKYTWHRPEFAPDAPEGASKSILRSSDPRFKQAEDLYKLVRKGAVVADYDTMEPEGGPKNGNPGGSNRAAGAGDEDVAF